MFAGLNRQFLFVDLIDGNNCRHVTVVPDIWIFQADDNSSKCWYPKIAGHISSKKREVPQPYWYVYPCIVRKEYGMTIYSFILFAFFKFHLHLIRFV